LAASLGRAFFNWDISTYEPAVTICALLAAIIGIFVDRWAANRDRRRELLRSVTYELYENARRLTADVFRPTPEQAKGHAIHPRLFTASIDAVIASGVFTEARDGKLIKQMTVWRHAIYDLNHRLDYAEHWMSSRVMKMDFTALRLELTQGPAFQAALTSIKALYDVLMQNYATESGVRKDTPLFS
jgi:hypothetical protein